MLKPFHVDAVFADLRPEGTRIEAEEFGSAVLSGDFAVGAVERLDDIIDGEINIPVAFFNLILSMANKSIKYDRYYDSWKYLMCLYIAHFCVLYLQTQKGDADSQKALQGALPTGVATSKSVDGLSISYDLLGISDDLNGYGTWKYTAYGQQLATLTKMYGIAGMWVNG